MGFEVLLPIPFLSSAMAKQAFHALKVDGRRRRFRVHIPPQYDGVKQLPVVIVLHGAASNTMNIGFATRMSRQAELEGFFAVYPSGTGFLPGCFMTWNAGGCCGPARVKKVDDVAFIDQVIETMKERYGVDPARVYVTGMSNGAMMSYRLALELPHKIAAIAPVEGAMMCHPPLAKVSFSGAEPGPGDDRAIEVEATLRAGARQDRSVSVVAFNGDRDKVIPVDGGTGRWFGYKINCPSAQDSIDFWVARNQCRSQPEVHQLKGAKRFVYSGGKKGAEVVLYRVQDHAHTWPGGPGIPKLLPSSKQISATEIMCQFFLSHPKNTLKVLQSRSDDAR